MPNFSVDSYVLLTRLPVAPKSPRDLHALSTPPAFILSQDQTLNKNYFDKINYQNNFENLRFLDGNP
jgi:hypothetical protein